jgi:conserved oligomeric Golgi complex subunit 2
MSSRFYFSPSDSDSDIEVDVNDSNLPFPKPLDRSAFLAEDFDPAEFLSSLTSRFQTLEDLHAELRDLSSTLQKELVDLVNDNYQDFLDLGSTLRGGGDRVEDVRVGLLTFQRDVTGLKDAVERRRGRVAELVMTKKDIRRETGVGRQLLEIDERIDECERKLSLRTVPAQKSPEAESADVNGDGQKWSDDWTDPLSDDSEDDYDDAEDEAGVPPRLKRRTEEFLILKHLINKHSPHPFLQSQEGRVRRIQETLLTDVDVAIRGEPDVKAKQKILQLRTQVER